MKKSDQDQYFTPPRLEGALSEGLFLWGKTFPCFFYKTSHDVNDFVWMLYSFDTLHMFMC